MTTTAPVSRRTALIGSIALLAGGTGMAASTASALAAPTKRKKSTKRAKATTGLTLPTSWKGTIFDAPRQNELQGCIDSYTELREYGAISKLSQKRLNECEGIVTFEDVDHPGESFTVKVARSVRLGYAATPATLVGDRGTRIAAHLDLVRTANPKVRALIVTVDGRESTTRRLPAKTPIVADLAPIDTIEQMTPAMAEELLYNAIHFSFSEEGPRFKVTVDQVKLVDGGHRIRARVRGTIRGTSVSGTWVGVSRNADGGYLYVFGKLPA